MIPLLPTGPARLRQRGFFVGGQRVKERRTPIRPLTLTILEKRPLFSKDSLPRVS